MSKKDWREKVRENPKASGMLLNADEVHLLAGILDVESCTYDDERMKAFVRGFCAARGLEVAEDDGNLYVRKGLAEAYPTVVAHLDTVHRVREPGRYRVAEHRGVWYAYDPVDMKQVGVGGDDKVGIFVALQLLVTEPVLKVALFRDEETGCQGSAGFDRDFFADSAFVLQCDRRGNSDFVRSISGTTLYSDEFGLAVAPILAEHGYSPCSGGLTDVLILAEGGAGCCVANMSAGYFDPHGSNETVRECDVANALSMAETICRTLGDRRWEHVAPKRSWGGHYTGYGWSMGWEWDDADYRHVAQRALAAAPAGEEEEPAESRERCPFCHVRISQEMWDEAEMDWFCYACGEYVSVMEAALAGSETAEARLMALA